MKRQAHGKSTLWSKTIDTPQTSTVSSRLSSSATVGNSPLAPLLLLNFQAQREKGTYYFSLTEVRYNEEDAIKDIIEEDAKK